MADPQHDRSSGTADPSRIIAALHALHVGELDAIRVKLVEARQACLELDRPDLAECLTEASEALDRADVRTYRKRVETVIARLGHLR
jgi:hypothetical protein